MMTSYTSPHWLDFTLSWTAQAAQSKLFHLFRSHTLSTIAWPNVTPLGRSAGLITQTLFTALHYKYCKLICLSAYLIVNVIIARRGMHIPLACNCVMSVFHFPVRATVGIRPIMFANKLGILNFKSCHLLFKMDSLTQHIMFVCTLCLWVCCIKNHSVPSRSVGWQNKRGGSVVFSVRQILHTNLFHFVSIRCCLKYMATLSLKKENFAKAEFSLWAIIMFLLRMLSAKVKLPLPGHY